MNSDMPSLPRHVAIIMDGNGRWAERRRQPRRMGHRAGQKAVRQSIEYCLKRGVEVLTLFAFSSENWQRPESEVSALMGLFLRALDKEVDELHENGVRLCFIGALERFEPALRKRMQSAQAHTADNTAMRVNVAVNYGGRWDIAQAARSLAEDAVRGELDPASIDEQRLGERTCLADLPPPDLFIRTGGEHRISNFLLWQLAYTELYFTDTLWPDVDADCLDAAFEDFAGRQRRFGRTGLQVADQAAPH